MREESKNSQPVIISDHHRALARQRVAVIHRERSRATGEGTTIGPDDHGAAFRGGFRGGPDVQIEAVLAGRRSRSAGGPALLLHAHRAKFVGLAHAFPMRRRTRFTPAQVTDRGRGKGDALINANVVGGAGDARDQASFGADRIRNRGGEKRGSR